MTILGEIRNLDKNNATIVEVIAINFNKNYLGHLEPIRRQQTSTMIVKFNILHLLIDRT